jgi:hypothetical protein
MTTAAPSTALATIQPAFTDAERLALAGFLAGYCGTRSSPPRWTRGSRCATCKKPPLADPRTTIRYDRARGSLDQHAT